MTGPGRCDNCGQVVPVEWLTSLRVSIAMTGARSSGKSVTIAVMITQLADFLVDQHKSFLTPVGDVGQLSPELAGEAPAWFASLGGRFAETYLAPLYHQRGLMQGTARLESGQLQPMMWSFRVQDRPCCLALIDAAGEDFQDLQPSDPRFSYLAYVDLVVSLIDPLKVPQIAAVLAGMMNLPSGSGDDLAVLHRVLQSRQAHRVNGGPPQALALVLSKFDVLQQLKDVQASPFDSIMMRPGAAMRRDPSLKTPTYDEIDGALLDAEIRGLLELMHGKALLNAAEASQMPFQLYASAALGVAPGTDALGKGGMSPFRVLDFLKATLTRRGVFQ
ncbi:hypothetical protein [Rudaeicoccus suwonensis]|uniref:hypothetical protein n=1 Tax=Rudaeicoccus suwonensis TaxID=657409 RepID=UPI0011A0B054|nr:hypothetical protein [Rudaeicoccus suwonensis]